jgi:hypothetical protein
MKGMRWQQCQQPLNIENDKGTFTPFETQATHNRQCIPTHSIRSLGAAHSGIQWVFMFKQFHLHFKSTGWTMTSPWFCSQDSLWWPT